MTTCPACAEEISPDARICPHCKIHLDDSGTAAPKAAEKKKSTTTTIVLIVMGCALAFSILCSGILFALLLPAIQAAREAARQSQCRNNLKQIGLALMMYESEWKSLPPAYLADADGKPMHSWRVLILPYLESADLYDQYDFSEPWDGPKNSRLLGRMPPVYSCPSHGTGAGLTTTDYAGVFGEHCVFRGDNPVRIADITDGTSNTLMVAEATGAGIPWMKPEDIDVSKHPLLGDKAGFSSHHPRGVCGLRVDGSVNLIEQTIFPAVLQALFTIDGGEHRSSDH